MLTSEMTKRFSLSMAVLLHSLVALLFLYRIDFSPKPVRVAETADIKINSYVYQPPVVTVQTPQLASHPKALAAIGLLKKTTHEKATHEKPIEKKSLQKQAPASPQLASQGAPPSELLRLLHAAIQQQQHYPSVALQLEREGRVTVMFTLYQNGSISNLKIVQSSGTQSLDDAAIAAVQDAVPFGAVTQYVKAPHTYRIDVAFELT